MHSASAQSPFRVVHSVCSHDCPDSCAVLVTVDRVSLSRRRDVYVNVRVVGMAAKRDLCVKLLYNIYPDISIQHVARLYVLACD